MSAVSHGRWETPGTRGTRGTRMDGASKKDTDEPFVVRHPQECIHEDQGRHLD